MKDDLMRSYVYSMWKQLAISRTQQNRSSLALDIADVGLGRFGFCAWTV